MKGYWLILPVSYCLQRKKIQKILPGSLYQLKVSSPLNRLLLQ